jgi:hypothetical protein
VTRARWEPGLVYAVPLSGGGYAVAQAIAAMMPNAVYVAVTSRVVDGPTEVPDLREGEVVALPAVVRSTLKEWVPRTVTPPIVAKAAFPNERFGASGYVGSTIYDAGLVAHFLHAFHGRAPWNSMEDEAYFDRLLAPGVSRPKGAVVLSPLEREKYRRQDRP